MTAAAGRRRVVVLGATGSIGRQAADVVQAHPDDFEVVALGAGGDASALEALADRLGVTRVALADRDAAKELAHRRGDLEVLDGPDGVTALASVDADVVLNAITGRAGLEPSLEALRTGTPLALANKESLIVAGPLVVAAAEAAGSRATHLIPVDSEHSALAQCLRAGDTREVARLVLTASGGPFRGWDARRLEGVTPAQALVHPIWSMGPLVTINSATLMNKGQELIEAHELFGVGYDALDVVVHPQSIVHSMVEFVDGATIAQLSPPDMRLPIQLALAWPRRLEASFATLDWTRAATLTFEPVDRETFRALDLAVEAGRRGGTHPAVLNAANEVAVAAFRDGALSLPGIAEVVEDALDDWEATAPSVPRELADALEADAWARARARTLVQRRGR